MPEIDAYRRDDRQAIHALYRRVFGHDAAEANQLRWNWQYELNPCNPPAGPLIWIAREDSTVVGQYATMPVKLWVRGQELDASWGMDVMVAPERQRQGLGEALFRRWDEQVGASLGLGLSDSSYQLFKKLEWPDVGPVPCLVKPLTRRALRRPQWPQSANRVVSAVSAPFISVVARSKPGKLSALPIRRFDEPFTALWDRIAPKLDLAVKRDAAYLNWKYLSAPHVRYTVAALGSEREPQGYAVYRHVQEPRGRVTLLVDFLTDPDDEEGLRALAWHVDQAAKEADSDKIRCFVMHEEFRRLLKKSGYFQVKSTMEFVVKINSIEVPADFYQHTEKWHVTLGDSDQDR